MAKKKGWSGSASAALRWQPGSLVQDIDTSGKPGFDGDKALGEKLLAKHGERLSHLQELLYANGRAGDHRSVLLVLQGMDTAGKGGIVRHVIGMVDPQGVRPASFGKPTEEELAHDFLWRIRRQTPKGGQLGVFDRSHYEDVLVVRVHELVPQSVWEPRYEIINGFEEELAQSGVTLVKCAMFVSLDEQKKRLAERLDRPDKYWKYNPGDIDERGHWPKYQEAYQAMLDRTSVDGAPWHIIPADRKWFSRLAVTELLIEALEGLNLDWPPADFDVEHEKARLAPA
ncbi:polyphosphate kinase 2 family protein [Tsukamurella asaccharolytica]|uniref:Polyphosphate kinase 2 family protein n=1 Tax=Tsukamurella asaccharolytica TaxID=2592067 RepID=A0A5C5RF37_9ACTN|nr:polyphosphate kinase 2 family protein [Tsukamurella asaccharolytica]TWS21144.1 polyphosphate kinase 2 family protein [Tsukamurella asaccharolytica]